MLNALCRARLIRALCLYLIMNTEQKSKWAETRAKGKSRFILSQGILRIGLLVSVLTTVGNYFFQYGFTISKIAEYVLSDETIFKFFFGWLLYGLLMGLLLWNFNEREFRKPERNKT
jgi:hypothetical protein